MSIITTSIELRNISGTQYAHNSFDKIRSDVDLATEELIDQVGMPIYDKAKAIYSLSEETRTDEQKIFLQHIQLPIAMAAIYAYNRANLVSHEDTGRKAKLDKDHESMPWEWMIDRDDKAALIKYQKATDRLFKFLESSEPSWKDSDKYKASKELLVSDYKTFNAAFNIDNSPRFYYLVTPLIKEIQLQRIKPALGDDYQPLIYNYQNNNLTEDQQELLSYVQSAIPVLTMALAVKRHAVQIMPEGVVQGFQSFLQGLNASNTATMPAIQWYSRHLEKDAEHYFDDIKRYRKRTSTDELEYQMLPKNDPKNKFART